MKKLAGIFAAATLLAATMTTAVTAQVPAKYPYTLVILPGAGGTSEATTGINDNGVTIGYGSDKTELNSDVTTYNGKTLVNLKDAKGLTTTPSAINNNNYISAFSQNADGTKEYGSIYRHKWVNVSKGSCFSGVNWVNSIGQYAGFTCKGSNSSYATVWVYDKGKYVATHLKSKTDAGLFYISNYSDALGGYANKNGAVVPAVWPLNSTRYSLGQDVNGEGAATYAYSMSENLSANGGTMFVVGGAIDELGDPYPCYWSYNVTGARRPIGKTPQAVDVRETTGYDGGLFIDAKGQTAVGVEVDSSQTLDPHAVIWTKKTGMVDLNTQIAPTSFELQQADTINSSGVIVGTGADSNADTYGFELIPTGSINANLSRSQFSSHRRHSSLGGLYDSTRRNMWSSSTLARTTNQWLSPTL